MVYVIVLGFTPRLFPSTIMSEAVPGGLILYVISLVSTGGIKFAITVTLPCRSNTNVSTSGSYV